MSLSFSRHSGGGGGEGKELFWIAKYPQPSLAIWSLYFTYLNDFFFCVRFGTYLSYTAIEQPLA